MCAAPNSPTPTSKQSNEKSTKSVPKWMLMKQQNKSSAGKTAKPTVQKSSGGAQKQNEETRNAKRARWAKKSKPVARPIVKRGPVHEYYSVCCSLPCSKPRCGMKVSSIDPETGKPAKKDKATGLGKWRCNGVGGCKKYCKVTRKAPAPKEVPVKILQAAVAAAPNAEARNAIIDTEVTTWEVPVATV